MGIVKDTHNSDDFLNHGFTYEPRIVGYTHSYYLENCRIYITVFGISETAEIELRVGKEIKAFCKLDIKGMDSVSVIDLLDETVDKLLQSNGL